MKTERMTKAGGQRQSVRAGDKKLTAPGPS